MIEAELEGALKGLIAAEVTDVPISLGETRTVIPKDARIVIHAEDAISHHASITNVFEVRVGVRLEASAWQSTENQLEEATGAILQVLSSPTIVQDLNIGLTRTDLYSARLYDMKREVNADRWVRRATIRFVAAIDL